MTDYGKMLMKNATIRVLKQKAEVGTITAKELTRLCELYGEAAGKYIETALTDLFPNGKAASEEIRSVISPILRMNHKLVGEATAMMINFQYKSAGIGIRAVIPEYDIQKEIEIAEEVSRRSFEDG